MKRIYWDTAAGTPVDERVLKAMKPFLTEKFGNTNSLHQEGVMANRAVEEARGKIARILSAHADEIIFTGSGTESDNLAILGTAEASVANHIITTSIEHKAVLEPCRHLQKKGFKVTYLRVDENGQIDLKEFREALRPDTFLVSIMLANNEMGAIQPIKEVAKILRHFKKENGLDKITGQANRPYLHIDACQAPRFLDLNVEKLGVDLMSFNSSKIYGPKGVGVLYVRRGVMMAPIMLGGGQERGLRSGTLNVPGIIGLARALEICEQEREKEVKKLTKLQIKLIDELGKISGLTINGPMVRDSNGRSRFSRSQMRLRQFETMSRLPNNINFSIEGFEGEQLVIELDAKGFAVSSGSACSSHDPANNKVRVSFGREVMASEINRFIKALKEIIHKYQKMVFEK
ncbi:MAG: cysteine desulfurase family protein [Candidatus Paceibacterota bacterium]|jgi:cysteine desulfurase